MNTTSLESTVAGRRIMKLYVYCGLSTVVLMMAAGLTMRAAQGGWVPNLSADLFYALLTLHGAGMVAGMLLCGMGILWSMLCRHVQLSATVAVMACLISVLGIVGALISTLFGGFAGMYTMLHPLPFMGSWPSWSTGLFLVSMGLVTLGWMLWSQQMLGGVIRGYGGLRGALAWDYVFFRKSFDAAGRTPPPPEAFPALLTGLDGLIAGTAGMLLMVALFVHWLDPSVVVDPLWAKNLTYFFGHTIANVIIYMLVGTLYIGIPYATRKTYHTSTVLVIAWWTSTTLTLTNYFHHLYLDFVQPGILSYIGQLSSYLSSIPVVVVTVFGSLMLIWRSKTRWSLGAIFLYTGMIGWVVGGIGAELDATIPFNVHLHNTLWVPAHFHTYLLGGCFLFILGWVFLLLESRSSRITPLTVRWIIGLLVFGGMAVFLAGFYGAGAMGIPRRYAATAEPGTQMAKMATMGASVMIVGLFLVLIEGLWLRLKRQADAPLPVK